MPGPLELVNTPFIFRCVQEKRGDIGSQLILVMSNFDWLMTQQYILAISESQPKREEKVD